MNVHFLNRSDRCGQVMKRKLALKLLTLLKIA